MFMGISAYIGTYRARGFPKSGVPFDPCIRTFFPIRENELEKNTLNMRWQLGLYSGSYGLGCPKIGVSAWGTSS